MESVDLQRRREALEWWSELGGNVLLRMIKQGELTSKYIDNTRKSSSLTGREIETIWKAEVQR